MAQDLLQPSLARAASEHVRPKSLGPLLAAVGARSLQIVAARRAQTDFASLYYDIGCLRGRCYPFWLLCLLPPLATSPTAAVPGARCPLVPAPASRFAAFEATTNGTLRHHPRGRAYSHQCSALVHRHSSKCRPKRTAPAPALQFAVRKAATSKFDILNKGRPWP